MTGIPTRDAMRQALEERHGKDLQKKFSDAVKVIDKENGGHGSVLNRGIEEVL